jgi:Plavaka transposase
MAKKLTQPTMATRPDIEKYGTLKYAFPPHPGLFRSAKDLYRRLDEIRGTQAPWYKCGGNKKSKFTAFIRDPVAVLQEILENSGLKGKVVYAPRKLYDPNGKRVYTDLYTTDWWWEMQASATDNSGLTQGNGRRGLWRPRWE